MSLQPIEEPQAPGALAPWQARHPLWRLGFRPFYLAGALCAALALPLWMLQYFGGWPALAARINVGWHMHEMVFGMAAAVVIGFLYTAARAWTGVWTPVRGALAALVLLWCAGRLAMLVAPAPLAAVVDWLFLPLAAWPLLQVLRQAGNRRNYFLVVLLGLMALANGLYHAIALGWLALPAALPVQAAILVIVLMESAIATRVLPMFTRNGAPGTTPLVEPRLDRLALGLLAAAALAWVFGAPAWLMAPLALAAALLVLLRLWRWKIHRTLGVPLLWILHFSYAWVALGLVLLALAGFGMVSASAAFHALTVGSMGGLILGMITRTTLGHTGRPLVAGRSERAIFVLIQLAALTRVAAALGWDSAHGAVLLVSAVCWTLAFLRYVFAYWPYLSSPRIDGKEG
ncbi:NnrS family protein [Oxalobacteraceae bacterium]|nr:NnrS family protein [Oxalobacteraceae bacterium]